MSVILYGLLPLLVFVVVDIYAGLRWAVASAAVFAVADIAVARWSLGVWDPGSFVALGLIVALGAVSLRTKNPVFFKLQPTVLAAIFAGALVYFQFFSVPIGQRYGALIEPQIPAEYRSLITPEAVRAMLDNIGYALIFVFLIHGALCAFAAFKLSNWGWLLVRGVVFWVLAAIAGIGVGVITSASMSLHG